MPLSWDAEQSAKGSGRELATVPLYRDLGALPTSVLAEYWHAYLGHHYLALLRQEDDFMARMQATFQAALATTRTEART